jgi:peptide/nickel transport system substrate-binding protein
VTGAHTVPGRAGCLAVFSVVAVVAVSGCSGYEGVPSAGGAAELGTTSDINPQDPATLRDGGDLKLAIGQFPPNFNVLNIDGNLADTGAVMHPTMPRAFIVGPDGSTRVDNNYFTSVELTSTNPQVVTYTINPKAVWSDGTPITWQDIAAQINATNGSDKSFAIAATSGADRVASVTRGVDDRQAVMTFAKPYSEWRGMFAGDSMLLPKTMNETPAVFNKGALNGPGKSAGPFIVTTLDKTAQRIALTRNPRWWGARPKLDSITFMVLDPAAVIPALQNGAIDAAGLASLDDVTTARRTKGISIRRAPAPTWTHFTFNGAPGSILADKALRLAIAKGIDRATIASVTLRGLANDPAPLNNHIYVVGQQGYQNNSAPADYNPDKARRELDALGWKLNGQFREKDGRQLVVRDLIVDDQDARQIGQIAQNSLAQVGVKLVLDVKPINDFFSQYVNTGDFDITEFSWVGDAFPLSALTQIYASDGESNFGKIGSPEIDDKIEQTLSALDPGTARALANQLDVMLWREVFSLPLTQSAGNDAVRSDLANFGPTGLADLNYTAIGFMK